MLRDLIAALKILRDNAVRDPVNYAVLPMIGAAGLFALWYYGWLSWDAIHYVICHDLC
jgi:hypothetical protein